MIVADNCIFHFRSPKRHFLEKTEGFTQGSITLALFMRKCDVMGQNQSHVAKNIKWQKFAFFLKMSKYVHFLFSSKTRYLCQFLSLKLIFTLFC